MKREEECRVAWCREDRLMGALFCSVHLNDFWAKRLTKLEDGTFIGTASPVARQPAWVERMALNAKDLTERAA